MTILETFIKLRDDLKLWVTNNLNMKPGKKSSEGGEVFNDYENNQANAKFSTAFGNGTIANGKSSIAGGTTDDSLVKEITGVDISILTDDLVTEALGERGIRLKDNLESNPNTIAGGDVSIAYGTGSHSITAMSNTCGVGTEAGSKGFYFHKITIPEDGGNITISLSTVQKPYYKYQQKQYIVAGDLVWKEANTDTKQWDAKAGELLATWAATDRVNIILKKIYCFYLIMYKVHISQMKM